MPEKATPETHQIYHIFLASPGDMNEERQMVRKFFEGYNRNIANRQHLEFKVIDWEHYTNCGVGRPQALITRQTLDEFRNSLVLVVGLLGQRFGTPTDIYESGTEEEFATAIRFREEQRGWPEIKWFFREKWGKQGPPEDPDQLMEASLQWKKVRNFRDKLQKSKPQLYTVDFKATDDFPKIFLQDLERWLHDPARPWNLKNNIQDQKEQEIPTQETPYLQTWLKLLANECAHLPLEILDARQGMDQSDPIGLPDIFVPLKAIAPTETWKKTREQNLALVSAIAVGGRGKPKPVLELLKQQRLSVVIGDPGSGKSALVNQLTWSLLSPGQKQSLPETLQGCIPLRIILRRVEIPADAKQGQAVWLWDTVEKEIQETLETSQHAGRHAKAVLESLKQKLMKPPGGLILLDGLDEIPSADHRRIHLLQAIQALVASLPPDHTRFIVTARPYAYTDPHWQLKDFTAFFLTSFDKEQRARFIQGWYDAARNRFSLRDADLKQRIPDLIDRVENQPHLRELAERPLLLTLISTLHASGGHLPEDRAQLYKNSVDLLLYHWRREVFRDSDGQPLRLDDGELLRCLQTLAYNAHQAQQRQADAEHAADISHAAILEAFEPMLEKLGRKDLLAFLQQHTGILIAREQNRFAFPHRSFQEYLAMGWLTAQTDDKLSPEVCADPLWWREVFLLAVIEQKQKPLFATSYIRGILECGKQQSDINKHRLYILSGLGLMELGLKGTDALTQTVRQGLVDLLQDSTALNVSERAEAGRVLGRIGDNRKGVGLNDKSLPDIDWVEIPPGEVVLQNNPIPIPVEPFQLARYPITYAQFQCFIDDPEGYTNPRWWAELYAKPGATVMPQWSEPNHPRVRVSWFEAMAFCAWLSERLGYSIQLPTEWQWQQAACSGQSSFDYPWGPEYKPGYANINEILSVAGSHFMQRTTTVGIYPQGDSLQGVSDLCGNVWEWCLNEYREPTNTQEFGALPRVVRGGSWAHKVDVSASHRGNSPPAYRGNSIGFRVCCVSPI